jgi:glycosyltransferase involved in cell wall biosynthesis
VVKAIDVLLGAAARLVASGVDLDLTVFGDGPERDRLVARARELGLADRVALPGFRPRFEIFETLAGAHAFAMASVVENQPFAVIEALCSGLPVVATAVGGVPELVGQEDGLLVPAGDPNALADALGRVAHKQARFESAAIAGRARARFSYETVATSLARVYTRALATIGERSSG